MLREIPFIEVLIAAAINFFIGFLWYSPSLFGRVWGRAFVEKERIQPDDMKPTPLKFLGGLVVALVVAYSLALLVEFTGISTLGQAIWLTSVCWLGFVATTHFSGVLWARKPLMLYVIDSSCVYVQLAVLGIFYVLWQ